MSLEQQSFIVKGKTLSVRALINESVIRNVFNEDQVIITKSEKGTTFFECSDITISQSVFDLLTKNEHHVSIVSYDLFFRSSDTTTENDAKDIFKSMCNEINIMYLRVDSNEHTGKLVVDTFSNYNFFRRYTDVEKTLMFFSFKTKSNHKTIKQSTNTNDLSLFFRSKHIMNDADVPNILESICNEKVNILYLRIGSNKQSGKIVVKSEEHYNFLKNYIDTNKKIKFSKFVPKTRKTKKESSDEINGILED